MGIIIQQSIKTTIITYVGVLIGAFNLLYLFPKLLSPEEIGLSRVLIDIALVAASVAQMGVNTVTDRFFPFFFDDKKKHNGFLTLIIIYPLIGFLLVSTLMLLLKGLWISSFEQKSPLLIDYFYYIFPLTFSLVYFQVLEAYTRVHYRIVISNFFKEVFLRIAFAVIVVLFFYKVIDLDGLVLWLVVSYFLALLMLISYIKVLGKLYIRFFSIAQNKKLLKEIFQFSLFIILTGLTGLIISKVDILILSSYQGLDAAGIYSIAFYIGTIIEIPRRALSQISVPVLSQAWKENDLKTIDDVYKKSSINQFIVGCIIFLGIWVNVDAIFDLMPNSEVFKAGKIVILFIGLSRLSDMITGVNSEIIITSPFYRLNFIFTLILSPVFLLLNFLLIAKLGMEGAAIATLVGILMFNLSKFIFLYFKVKLQPFSLKTLWVTLLAILTLVIIQFIPFPERKDVPGILVLITIKGILVLLLFFVPVVWLKISTDFNYLLLGIFKKISRTLKR